MITYKQGDIILVWFPDSNLITTKKRPAVVLQSNNLQTGLGQLIIGMITSVASTFKCQIIKGISYTAQFILITTLSTICISIEVILKGN